MPTSVPNFNFLALLVSEIKRVSQNLMWGLPVGSCGVITKMLSILLQEKFLENVYVPRNHGYPRLLLLLFSSAGKLSEGEM